MRHLGQPLRDQDEGVLEGELLEQTQHGRAARLVDPVVDQGFVAGRGAGGSGQAR